MNRRTIALAASSGVLAIGITVGACAPQGEQASAPRSQQKTATPKQAAPKPDERKDLADFSLDNRSNVYIKDVWVKWTITNKSAQKSDYTWEWEAIAPNGTRIADGTELVVNVKPGQTVKGASPTVLNHAKGVVVRVTEFNRTASY